MVSVQEKRKVRLLVRNAIRRGDIPKASELLCVDCGAQGQDYDHYLGYDQGHELDLQSVCKKCHGKRSSLRGERPHGEEFSKLLRGRMATGDANGSRKHPESRPRGLDNPKSKLSPEKVRGIRALFEVGVAKKELARMYGVDARAIRKVIQRKSWGHIT